MGMVSDVAATSKKFWVVVYLRLCAYFTLISGDEFFGAQENARIVTAAEEYYRNSFIGGQATWNVRDSAMVDMIEHSLKWYDRKMGGKAKCVVWAHNSHIGDASFTEHSQSRQQNVGQLVRERFGFNDTFILGFSTDHGTVRAGTLYLTKRNGGMGQTLA